MTEKPEILTAYVVVIGHDGSLATMPIEDGSLLDATISRKATNYDIYSSCREIVHEMDNSMLAEKVAATVLALQTQATLNEDAQFKQKISERLKQRKEAVPVELDDL